MGRPCRADCRRCGRRDDAGLSVLLAPGQPAVFLSSWTRGTTTGTQESDSSQRDWAPQPGCVQVPCQVWCQSLLLHVPLQLGGKLIVDYVFFVCFLYNACVGTVPIPCRANSVPALLILCTACVNSVYVRAVSIPALILCTCRVNSVHCTCRVNSGPSCLLLRVLKFFLCPSCHQKTWGRCRGP